MKKSLTRSKSGLDTNQIIKILNNKNVKINEENHREILLNVSTRL